VTTVEDVLGRDAWRELDEAMLPEIRAIRRNGPGRLRRAALKALLQLGGERSLDPADLSVLRRLIAIKQPGDRPRSLSGCWDHWLAVRGGDQEGILRVLGLDRMALSTYAMGEVLNDHLGHGGAEEGRDYRHVFVSPEINGWTLVYGPSCDPDLPRVREWVSELSARYGDAQAYYYGSRGDGDSWLVGVSGEIVRWCSSLEPETATGEPLPVERLVMAELGLTGRPEDLDDEDGERTDFFFECNAPRVARELSVDAVWVDFPKDPVVSGRAVIAWPSADDDVSVFKGCYGVDV
jgi:hypothetical protein